MKRTLVFIILIIVSAYYSVAQVLETKNWCLAVCDLAGDERTNTELVYLQLKNDSIMNLTNTDSIKRIPLRIAIIQEDSVEVEIEELVIRKAIENLNESFTGTNFVFFISRTDVIISDLKLEGLSTDSYNIYNNFSDKYDDQNMISVYIFDHGDPFCDVSPTSVSCGRTGGFSYILSARTNNIVMTRFDISNVKIFAHEMGHFWGLYHTFEEMQYGKDDFKIENCDLLGDRICDTPPDPGTIFEVYANYSTCELSNLKNKEGFSYKPLMENYMSYYKPCYLKKFSFTRDQEEVMKVAATLPFRKKFIR